MYLGEVITRDVIEAVEMPFGRQMVHLKLRTLSINRKMESCPMWDSGCVKPRVCMCARAGVCLYRLLVITLCVHIGPVQRVSRLIKIVYIVK